MKYNRKTSMLLLDSTNESAIKLDDAKKKRIELGWWIIALGEAALLFIVLYALFK